MIAHSLMIVKMTAILILALFAQVSCAADETHEIGYMLRCTGNRFIFTFQILDSKLASGKGILTIYERYGRGSIIRATTEVKADLTWNERIKHRYISRMSYSVGQAINFEVREKRGGWCESSLLGTHFRAFVTSTQPMLEVSKGSFECESFRWDPEAVSGGTSI